jgi:hypothetical protein
MRKILKICVAIILLIATSLLYCLPSRYYLIGFPIFELPKDFYAAESWFVSKNKTLTKLNPEKTMLIKTWIDKNRRGWASTISYAPPADLFFVSGNASLNFDFKNLLVSASFPISARGTRVQLDHPITIDDRNLLLKEFTQNQP